MKKNSFLKEKLPLGSIPISTKMIIVLLLGVIDITLIVGIVGPEIVETYSNSKIYYSFYVLIKWIVFISSSLLLIIFYYREYKSLLFITSLIMVLFNPFYYIDIGSRNLWVVIDVLTIFLPPLFLAGIYFNENTNMSKKLVKLLSNFTIDTPIKYTTHSWDFGSINKEYDNYQGFLNSISNQWETLEKELKNISPNLHKKIYNFLLNKEATENWCSNVDISIGWSSLNGLEEWCNEGNSPFDFKLEKAYEFDSKTISTFGDVISLFKREIEIRNENNMLSNIFIQQKKKLGRKFKIDLIKLEGRTFYTDVEKFQLAIKKIFEEIKKRNFFNIKVEVIEPNSESIEIVITQLDSKAGKSAYDMLKEVEDGDFGMLKENLKNLCDWSIESSYEGENYRVNYLRQSSIKEIEKLDYKPNGFTHILRFYKK